MIRVFVDTSAVLAFLVPSDASHERARSAFARLQAMEAALVTSSYVLVELYALLTRRFGLEQVISFRRDFCPLLDVIWVGRDVHEKGLDLLIQREQRKLSLVDATSFVLARERSIDQVFAYDSHFEQEGFAILS
ncbi:MAG: type II toxin-antitoxin system VapC family toxin [Deltaproteobacteria bacterium]|nr:type II toxin-antitoxin system VapC family toxin [Deltaproteobacteria bacterium]